METKFAPGKWRKDHMGIRNENGYLFIFPTYMRYENQEERYQKEKEERLATYDLVLAAPEMYKALKAICEACNKHNIEMLVPEYEQAMTALEKADTRQPMTKPNQP